MISGHDSNHLKSTGIMKQSFAEFQDCRIKLNKWQGIFVLDGSLKVSLDLCQVSAHSMTS